MTTVAFTLCVCHFHSICFFRRRVAGQNLRFCSTQIRRDQMLPSGTAVYGSTHRNMKGKTTTINSEVPIWNVWTFFFPVYFILELKVSNIFGNLVFEFQSKHPRQRDHPEDSLRHIPSPQLQKNVISPEKNGPALCHLSLLFLQAPGSCIHRYQLASYSSGSCLTQAGFLFCVYKSQNPVALV